MEWTFSKLHIVQNIDDHTPHCVLEDILLSHRHDVLRDYHNSQYRTKMIEKIKDLREIRLVEPFELRDWRILACFINPERDQNIRWCERSLLEAYRYLQQFFKKEKFTLADIGELMGEHPYIGYQTPGKLMSLNASVLYRLCKDLSLVTNSNTTLEEMTLAISYCLDGPDACMNLLASFISQTSPTVLVDPTTSIVNSLILRNVNPRFLMTSRHIPESRIDHETLESYLMETSFACSAKALIKRIVPISSLEAVAMAAKVFRKDISEAENPITEFRILSHMSNDYVPSDPKLRKIHILNPDLLDLKKTFNPLFPEAYYGRGALINMASKEGYSDEHIRSSNPYELLQLSTLLENFYEGIYPEIVNEETPIAYDDVNSLEPGLILCYGVRRESLIAFHIEEIVDHFRTAQNFIHPLEPRNVLNTRVIQKLKTIASMEINCSEDAQLLRRNLLRVIEEIELLSNETMTQVREFRDLYMEASSSKQEDIRIALRKFLHLAMYMRGWIGDEQPFPIDVALVDDQYQVNINVTVALNEFEDKCDEMSDEGTILLNLPLLKYRNGKFTPVRSETEGRTISERLRIVKEGDESENIYSCIRMTSNVFAATAYRYMILIGQSPPFNIENMRSIS